MPPPQEPSHVHRVSPGVTPADRMGFLALRGQMDENGVVRQFRAWIHQHLVGGGAAGAAP
jgi:hypothetical protein